MPRSLPRRARLGVRLSFIREHACKPETCRHTPLTGVAHGEIQPGVEALGLIGMFVTTRATHGGPEMVTFD